VSKIVVVPVAMAMSWRDSEGCFAAQHVLDAIGGGASHDAAHPTFCVLAHDGDNAFSGGYTYYNQCVKEFAHADGIEPTTVQTYLEQFPPADDDIVHVEDGAWINHDADFGNPQFVGWNWPLVDADGTIDLVHGWVNILLCVLYVVIVNISIL
jgi:hypothetical protein